MLPCVFSVIDHRGRQNVVRTSVTHSAAPRVLFLPHFDVICDLLLNRRTATWNLFVKYTPISKNVVGENGKWQSSKGNCSTERKCGFHICKKAKMGLRVALKKPHRFAYLTMKNSIFARFVRAFFIF